MMTKIEEAKKVYKNEGILPLSIKAGKFGYNYFRSLLPRRIVSYNGVPVRASHLGDRIIPWEQTDIPDYETALVDGIRRHVSEGDTVSIVGGGWGVSTVVAAKQVGETGHVITYEGGKDAYENVRETTRLNDINERVTVQHGIVAEAISLRGDGTEAKIIPPSELPECDVLVLDCEGAELEILEQMDCRPRTLLVETHGMFGATEAKVRAILKELDYEVTAQSVAEERLSEFCEEKGIYVLTAQLNPEIASG